MFQLTNTWKRFLFTCILGLFCIRCADLSAVRSFLKALQQERVCVLGSDCKLVCVGLCRWFCSDSDNIQSGRKLEASEETLECRVWLHCKGSGHGESPFNHTHFLYIKRRVDAQLVLSVDLKHLSLRTLAVPSSLAQCQSKFMMKLEVVVIVVVIDLHPLLSILFL